MPFAVTTEFTARLPASTSILMLPFPPRVRTPVPARINPFVSRRKISPRVLLVATKVTISVRKATPAKVPASPTLSPIPSFAVISSLLVEIVAPAAAALVIDPRSASAAPSTSAFKNTVWDRPNSVATMLPVSKIISSPALKVSDESAAVPVNDTTALLLIRISSLIEALLPEVNIIDAPTLMLALMVRGLFAARKPPPPAVDEVFTLIPPARSVMPTEPFVLKPSRKPSISMSSAAPIPGVPTEKALPADNSIRPLVADKFASVSRFVPSTIPPVAPTSMAVPVFTLAVKRPSVMFPPKFRSESSEIVPVLT